MCVSKDCLCDELSLEAMDNDPVLKELEAQERAEKTLSPETQ